MNFALSVKSGVMSKSEFVRITAERRNEYMIRKVKIEEIPECVDLIKKG